MTARRLMYLSLITAFIISSFATGQRILFICSAVFAGIFMLVFLVNLSVLIGLKLEQHLTVSSATTGDEAKLRVIVRNRTPFPIPEMIISYALPQSLLPCRTLVWIAPFEKIALTCDLFCPHRGVYEVGLCDYSATDLLGLTTLRRRYNKKVPLTVYPVLFRIALGKPSRGAEGESPPWPGTRSASGISDIIPYVQGHTMRHMHWKLTARRRMLMMKVFEDESEPEIVVLINSEPPDEPPESRAFVEDMMLSVASSVCYEAMRESVPVRVMAYPKNPVNFYGSNPGDFQSLYSLMAMLQFGDAYTAPDALRQTSRLLNNRKNALVYITPEITPDVYDILSTLALNSVSLNVVMVSNEDSDENEKVISALSGKGIWAVHLRTNDNPEEIFKARQGGIGYGGTF